MAAGSRPESPAASSRPRRILFLDAYDSFTNNIVSLLRTVLGAEVFVVRIDLSILQQNVSGTDREALDSAEKQRWSEAEFLANVNQFDAVVCGPGPGSPLKPEDVGVFRLLWELPSSMQVPVLGICLGFQSLVAAHGGRIRRLKRGLHGMVREIEHQRDIPGDIFHQVPTFKATLYHSLCADIGQGECDVSNEEWHQRARWQPTAQAPELQPLAWATECREDGRAERILMGVQHINKPLWGLQYHPESVCTEPAAQAVLKNWFQEAVRWNDAHGRVPHPVEGAPWLQIQTLMPPSHVEKATATWHRMMRRYMPQSEDLWWTGDSSRDGGSVLRDAYRDCEYVYETVALPQGFGVPEITEALEMQVGETIILDASSSKNGDPLATSSIIGCGISSSVRFEYHASDDHVTTRITKASETISLDNGKSNIWEVLSHFWEPRSHPANAGNSPSAFKGGFMGFATYEMGLYGLDKNMIPENRGHNRPDLCMVWVTKSIVLDHKAGVAYVQELKPRGSEQEWIKYAVHMLQSSEAWGRLARLNGTPQNGDRPSRVLPDNGEEKTRESQVGISTPDPDHYEGQVRSCQDLIAAGESYELCLTSQTTITRPPVSRVKRSRDGKPHLDDSATPWSIFKTLRQRQPAPFGSFIRLGGATLISSSPERFLSHDKNGLCSMRPMKGTVRKSEAVSTVAQAEKILHVPKEEAENLMIVDLVRHDLHGICGVGNVTVPDLLKVEEYATVFQMITVVNGQLPRPTSSPGQRRLSRDWPGQYTGLDALSAALPPGSMTGAPKKRSCEMLQGIEGDQERSLYSGVVGYMDVTGAGDWSVTIRSIFRWDDEKAPAGTGESEPREVWRIGAGGAVTILSTPEGEREEMFVKLAGPLGTLRDMA